MKSSYKIIILYIFISSKVAFSNTKDENSPLLRRKRYLVFPEGSSLSVAICLTFQTILPEQIFTEAVNWGMAYDLPNDTSIVKQFYRPQHVSKRRNRRDVYQKMEIIMDSMGYDGRSCILRALCEASRYLITGNGILEELLRIVFDFPLQRILNSEPEEHRLYHWASRLGKEEEHRECSVIFSGCSFSLLDMALGKYSYNTQDEYT